MTVVPVILCGGSGTRLWPLSRRNLAKHHIGIMDGELPYQRTLRRLAASRTFGKPIVIAGQEGRFLASDQAEAVGVAIELVLEPMARDTLPAVTLGALLVARRDPRAVAFVLPSDHLIPDPCAFGDAAALAAEAAEDGDFVVLGLAPTRPASGYGYIRPGETLATGARRVGAFVEKPDIRRAAALIAEGCLWNAGMFCFRADAALAEIGSHAPGTRTAVESALAEAREDLGALRLGKSYAKAEKVSFDYAVMERTKRAAVVPVGFDWSDIGDWREVWALSPKDENGVAAEGPTALIDVENSYIRADKRLVAAIGVRDLVVVDTPDALLISHIDRTQEVKSMVARLEAEGRPEAHTPAQVRRPWGWYQTMDLGDRFRVKRIQVAPGKQLSLQRHHHRAEHWIVVRGTAEVTRDSEVIIVRENESIYLPLGCTHRLANPGRIPVEIIEVQTGSYLEEDDIVRIEDDFGRC